MIKKIIFALCGCLIIFLGIGCKQIQKVNLESVESENQIVRVRVNFDQIETKTMKLSGNMCITNKTNQKIKIALLQTRMDGAIYIKNQEHEEAKIILQDIKLNYCGKQFQTWHDDPFSAFISTEIPPNETTSILVFWSLKELNREGGLNGGKISINIP